MAESKQPVVDLSIIGQTGLKRTHAGAVYEEFHRNLYGAKAVEVYTEMSQNDAIVGAVLHAVEMLMRQSNMRIKPAKESNEGIRSAKYVEECLSDMSLSPEDLISEILSMLPYGWSYHELVYKRREGPSRDPRTNSRYSDGKIGWRKISSRSQDTLDKWEFQEDGGIAGLWQIAPPDYKRAYIPIQKALLFRTTSRKGNPEAKSILRNAYRSWYFLKRFQELEAIGAERDLAGLPVMLVPPQVLLDSNYASQLATFQKQIGEIRRDEREGLIFPAEVDAQGNHTGYSFKLMSTGGNRQFDTNLIIRRYQHDIAASALAEFILLGMDKVGSFALASTKTHLFGVALGAWLQSIAAVINRFAIPRLWELNGFPTELMPTLEPGDIESPPLAELGTFLRDVVGAGVLIPDKDLERDIRHKAGLPPPGEENELERMAQQKAKQEASGAENPDGDEGSAA